MGFNLLSNENYRNKNINSNSNQFLKKMRHFEKLYNMRERFGVYNKTKFNQVQSELAFIAKRMVGTKPGETLDNRAQRALNYIARRKGLRLMKTQKDKSFVYNLAKHLDNTKNLDVFRTKSLAQMYGPAKKIQNAYRSYRYQKTRPLHEAARTIQEAWRRRNLRVPRNRINDVVQIPLNNKYVVQFKEGRARRLVAPSTMKYMRNPNGAFVSALSKQPIKKFLLRRVQYYNVERNEKNEKNLRKKIKKASKKQNTMRRGKTLLRPVSQIIQNAQLAQNIHDANRRRA